jgi:hypothetical protein
MTALRIQVTHIEMFRNTTVSIPRLQTKAELTNEEQQFIRDIFDLMGFISNDSIKPYVKSKLDIMSRAIRCPTLSVLLGHQKILFYKNVDGHIISQEPIATIVFP